MAASVPGPPAAANRWWWQRAADYRPGPTPAAEALDEVVVRPRPALADDYQRFLELFLGTSSFARQCQVRNPTGRANRLRPGGAGAHGWRARGSRCWSITWRWATT
ncbi:MAG: hypothetical protein WKG07_09765 [Hymenobacter sp.]